MWEPFEKLADDSRIWIYQLNRALTTPEENEVSGVLESFCNQWLAHGAPLRSSFKIDHHQFLILCVDERWSGASGCSIDGSVRILKDLQDKLGVDFFDRTKAAFFLDDKVRLIPLKEINEALASGILSASSPSFNTLIATKNQLTGDWILPLERTWLAKYLPKTTLA